MKTDFDWGPDGDLWSSSGPATVAQKMKFIHQRREAIALVRAFLETPEAGPRLYGKAKAFLFDVEHA